MRQSRPAKPKVELDVSLDRRRPIDGIGARDPASTGRSAEAKRGRRASAWKNVLPGRDEQFALKRKALLREAARAFNAKGYHDTSLADVAKTLGVTKTALYYYVKSKEEILFECHLLSLELGDQAIAFANEFGRNGREKVKLLARKYLELMMSEIGSPAVLVEVNALSDANRKRIAHRRDAFEQYFRGLVRKGITDGSLRDVDPKLLVFYFMGAVNWLSLWFRPTGEYSGNHIADEFSKLLDEAIGRASACSQMRTGKGGRATRERA